MDFNSVTGLDLNKVKNEISFHVDREGVLTDEETLINKKAMTRMTEDGKKVLGLVSPKRQIIPYSEMMDWVVGEFQNVGIPFKLQESSIVRKSDDLFQQYLFDMDVDNPDGQDISPMLILRGSHVGTPLKIDMGTYRFVCANGAIVGKTFKTISVKAKDIDSLLRYGLRDNIAAGIESMRRISARYHELESEDMYPYFMSMFTSTAVPVSLKKAMFDFLSTNGTIQPLTEKTVKNQDFLTFKLEDNLIVNRDSESILEIVNPVSAWKLYNDATEISTHSSKNEISRSYFYRTISEVFAA